MLLPSLLPVQMKLLGCSTGAAYPEQAAPEEVKALGLIHAPVAVLHRQVFASLYTFSESTWPCCIAVCFIGN